MSSFEKNKIFAAILCAALVVMLSGFIANKLVKPEKLKEDAVAIDGAPIASASGGAKKPALPEPVMGLLAEADLERGAKISKQCTACHSFEKGGATKQGPNLWQIVNKSKTAVSGYKYSDALQSIGGKWSYDSLNKFLWKPKKYAPGTKMSYKGLKKPQDRAAIIAWLRQQASSPAALPSAGEISAEQAAFAPAAADAPEAPASAH